MIREYAADTLGSVFFSPWLETYTAHRGTFVEGWIPDNYHRFYVVPHANAALNGLPSAINGKLFSQDRFPDLAYVFYGQAYGLDGTPIAADDINGKILSEHPFVYLKKTQSSQGRGVLRCDRNTLAQEIATCTGGIIQRPLTIHPDLSMVFPHATPTLRITTVHIAEKSRVVAAYMRFGSGEDGHVKSESHVRVNVALDTGVLGEEGYLANWTPVSGHPDTMVEFKGRSVPSFLEACDLCRTEHAHFPSSRYMGWDVAVTEDEGIMFFEANTGHADIKFSEASHGPIFAGLGWDKLHLQDHAPI
ncbi:sugar-transfer associated ATP-grasp domain-containing protein [Shimia ponticola]|uniref:sugar-transfer associated ATP-grasp domain-containing protein n=1 Tax=Shimia ponticola TaxID=2582893 RepID=UPI00164A64F0|nr:sugar-transfer associated ATP-grasp domain-containing protein [Shimia ponticola]